MTGNNSKKENYSCSCSEVIGVDDIGPSVSDVVGSMNNLLSVWVHGAGVLNWCNSVGTVESTGRLVSPCLPVGTGWSEFTVMMSDVLSLIRSGVVSNFLVVMVSNGIRDGIESEFWLWGSESHGSSGGNKEAEFHSCLFINNNLIIIKF